MNAEKPTIEELKAEHERLWIDVRKHWNEYNDALQVWLPAKQAYDNAVVRAKIEEGVRMEEGFQQQRKVKP